MFDNYIELAKQQYPDFDFIDKDLSVIMNSIEEYQGTVGEIYGYDFSDDSFEVDQLVDNPVIISHNLPKGYIGCIFEDKDKKSTFLLVKVN